MLLGILRDVVERHADEAAFLWSQRQRGSRSPLFDLAGLSEWDERLAANLEGLLIAESVGLEICLAALEGGAAGRLFSATWVAAELRDAMAIAKLVVSAEQHPARQREIISAIAWLSPEAAKHVLGEMTDERAPTPLRSLGISGLAARGEAPEGELLSKALESNDEAALQLSAAAAAGQLGQRALLPSLKARYAEGAGELALTAACSAIVLGDARAGEALWSLILNAPAAKTMAEHMRMRDAVRYACVAADDLGASKLATLAQDPETQTWALAGAAALGDPASIPFVLELMADENVSRLCAWAYASITGLALEPPFAERAATVDPTPEQVVSRAHDPVEDLPAPDRDQIVAHWDSAKAAFEGGKRYRAGTALSDSHLQEMLRSGKQPWRYDSALALAHAGAPLFSVAAPSPQQQQRLAAPAEQAD